MCIQIGVKVDLLHMFDEVRLNVLSVCNNNKKGHFLEQVLSKGNNRCRVNNSYINLVELRRAGKAVKRWEVDKFTR